MMDFEGKLPKGMKLPKPPVEEEDLQEETYLNSSDINYGKLIRDSLMSIKGIDIDVISLYSFEEKHSPTRISIELTIDGGDK